MTALPLTPSLLGMDAAEPKQGSNSAKVKKAAQEFEALLIGEMLKATRESGSGGWLGSGDGAASQSAMGLAETQLAQAIAQGGGLGLAQLIDKELTRPGEGNQNKSACSSTRSPASAK